MTPVLRFVFLLGVTAVPVPSSPESVVDRFQEAVRTGNREQTLSLLSQDVVIFEEGEAEMGRDQYAATHLAADIEFAKTASTRVIETRTGAVKDAAWVLRVSETSGTFGGKTVTRIGTETALLKKENGRWRIVHLHWSGHRK
ncbi:MAG: nuclear transport factor 2 family protein [Acidobacteriota bacterium]|nr:nuclear transport factor 2 family protein [Acidobacteriota bacterium]